VSDLGGSDAQVALFGEAHKDHYSQVRGWGVWGTYTTAAEAAAAAAAAAAMIVDR
jgi:hypothetical protein